MTDTVTFSPADLFEDDRRAVALDPGAALLGGFARDDASALLADIAAIAAVAPFRHLVTPGGRTMSVAMTNCGDAGWTSDRGGYRYAATDPLTGDPWPVMPARFEHLARRAGEAGGFAGFRPDVCLINRYAPGSRLTLHQDLDEHDLCAPIVSVSLGVPATFLWGGQRRSDRPRRIGVRHGDVTVWGGPARRTFHGVDVLAEDVHRETGPLRYNLTFRQARG